MSNRIAVFAASVPLMLTAAGAFGRDFQTPSTDRAQQTQPQLSRAAQAVREKVASTGGDRISNLWLYPTGDDHTVFAQYTVTSERPSSKAAAAQMHLELLQLQGDRVVEERDFMRIGDDNTRRAEQVNGERDWSASIGNGHTTSSTAKTSVSSEGSPASPHWTALIGSGQAGDGSESHGSTQRLEVANNAHESPAARAHWTSKIGTARAFDSNTNTRNGKSPS